jgi:4-amino-4-deoxy-L-arabinose transferase-like glycosyltransferase
VPILLAAGAMLFLVNLGGYPIYTKGEAREAVTIFDIVHGGGWILPMRAGVEIPSKPLMMHWMAAILSLVAGGVNEWTVRLPSALLAIAGMLVCYAYVRRLFDEPSALLAALMLGTTFQYLQAGTGARVDTTLTFFMEVAFFEFISIAEGLSRRWIVLYLAIAAAVLTKGPVGLVLPVAVALLWIAFESRWDVVGSLHLAPGVAVVGAVAGGWYVAAVRAGGMNFVHKQILAENILRFFGGPQFHEGHVHPFYYVELALLAGFLPWTLFMPTASIRLVRSPHPLGSRIRYLMIWFSAVLIFYNLPQSKRGVYLLALYPALSSLIAISLNDRFATPVAGHLRAVASIAGLFILAAGLGGIGALAMLRMDPLQLGALLARVGITAPVFIGAVDWAIGNERSLAIVVPLVTAGIGLYLMIARPDPHPAIVLIAAGVVSIVIAANVLVGPAIAATVALKGFALDAMTIVADRRVAYLEGLNYDVAFYSGRRIPIVGFNDRDRPDYLFCRREAYERLEPAQRKLFNIALSSGPTELDGTGSMLLLKRNRN